MRSKHLLLMLLLALMAPWVANAQSLFSEDFEDGSMPTGWTEEQVTGTTSWSITTGDYSSSTGAGHGNYNAKITANDRTSKTKLITPEIDLSTVTSAELSFMHIERDWYGDTDELRVYYRTSSSGTWTLLDGQEYTSEVASWTTEDGIVLPNLSSTYQIAFEFKSNYGYGVGIDYVQIVPGSSCPKPTLSNTVATTDNRATITWTPSSEGQTLFDIYWSTTNTTPTDGTTPGAANQSGTSYTINGLTANTTYYAWVRGNCGTATNPDISGGWAGPVNFTTECEAYPIPYRYGFEDEADMNCWTVIATGDYAGINEGYAHTGDFSFVFYYTEYPGQYLISPQLSGIANGLHVEFWYRQYTSGVETFQVGTSTTDNDPDSFTWGNEITASTEYQRFSANYPATVKYVAVKHTSDDQYYLFLDDFLFEESASCLEPTNVVASNETTTGATLTWTNGGEETAWDIFVTSDATIVPDDGTTPTYANVTTKPYPLTGLTPATTYYVYVRAKCTENSAWSSPAVFNTDCEAEALPYSYNFNDPTQFDICWNVINTNTSYNSATIMPLSETDKCLAFYIGTYSSATLAAVLPEVDAAYPLNEYEITFDACYANTSTSSMTSGKLRVGIMTDPADFETFELVKEIDITDGYSTFGSHTVRFNNYSGTGRYIAIQDVRTAIGYVLVDDIEVNHLPACLEPSDPVVSNITNHTAKLDWTGTSAGYNIDYRTAATIDPVLEEGFEHEGSMPEGWTHIGNGYTTIVNDASRVHTGTYSLRFSSATSDNVIVLPDLGVEANTLTLSFWSLAESSSSSGTFQVGYVTSATDATTFQQVGSYNASAHTSYTEVSNVSLAAAPAGARIAFRHTSASSSYWWWIDDIVIGSPVAAGAWQHTTSTTNTKTLESLLASRKYDVRVQGDCGDEGTSQWSDIVSFTTDIPCPAPTGLAATNPKSSSIDLSWTKSYADAWQVCYNDGTDHTVDVATDDVTIEEGVVTYTLTELTKETDYTVKVRENCGTDGYSEWTTPDVAFSTIAPCSVMTPVVSNITHHAATVNWDGESESGFTVKYREPAGINPSVVEGFEHEGSMPEGWTHIGNGYTTIVNDASRVHTGTYSLRFSSATYNNVIVLPDLGVEANTLTLSFWSLAESSSSSGTFQVGYVTSATDATTFQQVGSYNASAHTSYTEVSNVSLAAAPAGARIAFRHTSASSSYWWWIDDIVIGTATAPGAWQTVSATDSPATIEDLDAGTNYELVVAPNCSSLESDVVEFTTVSANEKWFINEGNWDDDDNWEPEGEPTIDQDVVLKANATIATGTAYAKSIAGTGTGDNAKTLTIESGAKLKHLNYDVKATVKKTITGYGAGNETNKADYYLISNPLYYTTITTTSTPAISTTGLLTGNYDFYNWVYSASDGNEWRNYEKNAFNFDYGLYGYLYANEATTTLAFTGTIYPYTSYQSRSLSASSSTTQDFPGWYLLGNPYMYDAYLANGSSSTATGLPYVKMNAAGDGFENVVAGTPIEPMTGFFYQATTSGSVYVVTTAPAVTDAGLLNMNLRSGNKQLDNAIVAFGSEQKLEKFSFRANSSKIYMPVEGKDYAITNAEAQGEMPVSFKAEKNGSYTLSFSNENVEFGYLHLIDNMTGEDVNLLETPSYSFEAKTTDYASRFKLVFSTGNGVNEESFAFISDGNIILNGEGMLQVVDVMGRIMMQEENATSVSTNGMTPGVYVLRLINGDSVRTQKIVVK